jgi:hypothetical protein
VDPVRLYCSAATPEQSGRGVELCLLLKHKDKVVSFYLCYEKKWLSSTRS